MDGKSAFNRWVGLVALGASACGAGPPASPFEPVESCAVTWQSLATDVTATTPLVPGEGVVYFANGGTAATTIWAQPTTGGPATTVASVTGPSLGYPLGTGLWLESGRLIFTIGERQNRLESVTVAGGDPQLLLDGGAGRADPGWTTAQAVTATDFFWAEESPLSSSDVAPTIAVWRASRSGGTPVQLGTVVNGSACPLRAACVRGMAVADGAVIVAVDNGNMHSFPFAGDPPRSFAAEYPPHDVCAQMVGVLARPYFKYAGIDASGVYWSIPRDCLSPDVDSSLLLLSPSDGGPTRVFWDGLPRHSFTAGVWSDDGSGWTVLARQDFAESAAANGISNRLAVWTVDAGLQGRRLGCTSSPTGLPIDPLVAPGVAPDAVFVLVSANAGRRAEMYRVPR